MITERNRFDESMERDDPMYDRCDCCGGAGIRTVNWQTFPNQTNAVCPRCDGTGSQLSALGYAVRHQVNKVLSEKRVQEQAKAVAEGLGIAKERHHCRECGVEIHYGRRCRECEKKRRELYGVPVEQA